MGQLTINVNGHHYTIGCADGEEGRLQVLAEELGRRMDALVAEVGQIGPVTTPRRQRFSA